MSHSLASWTSFQISEALRRSFPDLSSFCDAVVMHGVNGQRLVEISHSDLVNLVPFSSRSSSLTLSSSTRLHTYLSGAPTDRLTELDGFVRELAEKTSSKSNLVAVEGAVVRVGELFVNDSSPASNRITFHLSGFGPFNGVDDNPTQRNMEALPELLKSKPLSSPKAHLATISVVETSAVGALFALGEMNQTHTKTWGSSPSDKVVFLHFGVHSGATSFRLENFAYNEANFRVPDERGWSPHQQPILPKRGPPSSKLTTSLPVEQFSEIMRGKGFPSAVSQDAGRFLCNYIYFQSLHFAEKNGCHSLFVHVPPFKVIPKETQLEFIRQLISVIADHLSKA